LSAKIREKIRECIARLSTAVSRGELSEVFRGFEEDLCEGAVRGLDIDQFRSYDEWVRWLLRSRLLGGLLLIELLIEAFSERWRLLNGCMRDLA
jgi:hypothetical protein